VAAASGTKSGKSPRGSKGSNKPKGKGSGQNPKYVPITPGKTSPKHIKTTAPKPVSAASEHSGSKGHIFGMYRLVTEKK
jgi:hypothetical protein